MIAAVVPVAFFTHEHVEMTRTFLAKLTDEVDEAVVFHNGGPLTADGWKLADGSVLWVNAAGWPFYRMWNVGIQAFPDAGAVLVLNNDIEWDEGALRALGGFLVNAEPDVAIVSPSVNGEPRWCFAIRPTLAPEIDERYNTWYGDTELECLIAREGLRKVHFDPGIRHPHIQTTTDHLPDVHDLRLADMRLFDEKWNP